MTYIYAYSNYKYGLDRLRRMAVLYKELKKQGLEVEMLTNDHRASGAARDLGVKICTTVETILDIDLVAKRGDILIIDSPEDDIGKIEVYAEMYEKLYKIANSCDEQSLYTEQILQIEALVAEEYVAITSREKEDRTLLFFSDSDSDKYLLKNADFFQSFGFELLLGEYFYVDYESDLEDTFSKIHESEEYMDLISNSKTIVTSSVQTAYEAYSSGANIVYLDCSDLDICIKEHMEELGISIVDMFDTKELENAIKNSMNHTKRLLFKTRELAELIAK